MILTSQATILLKATALEMIHLTYDPTLAQSRMEAHQRQIVKTATMPHTSNPCLISSA
jgi:hypothetical protein